MGPFDDLYVHRSPAKIDVNGLRIARVMKMWNPVCPDCDLAFVGRAFTDAEIQRTAIEAIARQPRCSRCGTRFAITPMILWQEEHGTARFRLPLA